MSTNARNSMDKCSLIINRYAGTEKLHPSVDQLVKDALDNFVFMLNYDLEVIKARSQDLDDHEITAAQKAFSLMVSEGNSSAAVAIYVEEVLGFNYVPPKEGMLGKLAAARRLLIQDESEHPERANSASLPNAESINIKDGNLQHLLEMCENAKKAFHAKRHGTWAQKEAAKFLCGTIENTINYNKSLGSSEPSSSSRPLNDAEVESLESLHSSIQGGLIHGFERKGGNPSKRSKQVQGRLHTTPIGEDAILHGKISKHSRQVKDRSHPIPAQTHSRPALKREDAILRSPARTHPTLVREDAVLRSPYQQHPRAVSPVQKNRTFSGIPRGGDRYRPTY